ncbi:L-histidine N(alpha)-methyltransferase [bacterium]|jgi:L-histidine Nalpha-methyltransferase|nr:L-histidine N(alpha)-methyltransferase [bacterium]
MIITELEEMLTVTENESGSTFVADVLSGLSAPFKQLSPMYFYDDIGSELFQQITRHEDYYPTRKEVEILNRIKDELPQVISEEAIDIIELGAGDGHKSNLVIEGFLSAGRQVNFYPIDISKKALTMMKETIPSHPNLTVHGVVADYAHGLSYIKNRSSNPKLVLFLGSNIGNFERNDQVPFLKMIQSQLSESTSLLIGFDMKKDEAVLNRAYNDSAGLTRAFNLNLLTRINTELGGEFDLSSFAHHGYYNADVGGMESYLVSTKTQDVTIRSLNKTFHFDESERIHVEYSFKFSNADIAQLGERSGFEVQHMFSDQEDYFVDALWKVV